VVTDDFKVLAQYLLKETENKGVTSGQIAPKFTASDISLCQHFTLRMPSFQEIIFVSACDNAIHFRKSFAVRIDFSGLCSFKFNSMAQSFVMLCQDGNGM
jgi:hypothetical protein